MNNALRTLVAIAFLAVLLAGGIFIVNQLDQSQAPDDAAAGGNVQCGPGTCVLNGQVVKTFGEDCNFPGGSCADRKAAACAEYQGAIATGSDPITCTPEQEAGQPEPGCVIENPSATGSYIKVGEGCNPNDYTFKVFRTRRTNTITPQNCFTSEGPIQQGAPPVGRNILPNEFAGGCGYCVQIDLERNDGSRNYGTCNCTEVCQSEPPEEEPPTITEVQCGEACTSNAQCPNNHTCSAGKCTKNTCLNATCGPDTRCGTPVINECGEECSSNANCPEDHTCTDGTCTLDSCVDGTLNCDATQCNPIECGDGDVDPGEECGEPGLTCAVGSRCSESQCICITGSCGGDCSADDECPNDHSCEDGTCKLDICIDDPSACEADECTPLDPEDGPEELPETAIISDEADRVLLGSLLVIIALLVYRTNIIEESYKYYTNALPKLRIQRNREEFEDKFGN